MHGGSRIRPGATGIPPKVAIGINTGRDLCSSAKGAVNPSHNTVVRGVTRPRSIPTKLIAWRIRLDATAAQTLSSIGGSIARVWKVHRGRTDQASGSALGRASG